MLPDQDEARRAGLSSQTRHTYPSEDLAASRAAFGRVLADLSAAGLLDGAPQNVRRLLRTIDTELVGHTPSGRPNVVPAPPGAGHDQTITRWCAEVASRLEQYIQASTDGGRVLIGAKSRLTVLNWGHLDEELVCGTTLGTGQPAESRVLDSRPSMILRDLVTNAVRRRPVHGDPLVVENVAPTFHQIHADWLSFRPEVAAVLDWMPDSARPGAGTPNVAISRLRRSGGWTVGGDARGRHSRTLKPKGMQSSSPWRDSPIW